MNLKFKFQILNDDGTVKQEKEFKTLKQIGEYLKIDYQTCNKFYKLCSKPEAERKLKGLHQLLLTLYKRYRVIDNFVPILDIQPPIILNPEN